MNLRSVLLAATVLALPAGAMAQPVNGIYIGGGLGYHYTQDINVKTIQVRGLGSTNGQGNFGDSGGVLAVGSVGYGFGNGLRAELEGNWRENNYHLNGVSPLFGGADTDNFGVMANILYDFNVGWPVTPYVGVGVGYEWTKMHNGHANFNAAGGGGVALNYSGTPGAFAAQAILGAAYNIAAVPGLALTAEFRFFGVLSSETFHGTATGTVAGLGSGSTTSSIKLGNQYDYAGLIGIRYAFNAAPPPPPPAPAPVAAPAPAPARTYLVFFDWDKATLTDRARQIIAEAAQNSTRVQVTKIEVNGYTDTSGSPNYNMGLSRRRADTVAAELVRLGVPKNVIAIQAFGQTHLLVPTAAGVREPQNRRVEIILK